MLRVIVTEIWVQRMKTAYYVIPSVAEESQILEMDSSPGI